MYFCQHPGKWWIIPWNHSIKTNKNVKSWTSKFFSRYRYAKSAFQNIIQIVQTTSIFSQKHAHVQQTIIHRSHAHAKVFSYGFIPCVHRTAQTKYFIESIAAAAVAIQILFGLMTNQKFMSCQRFNIMYVLKLCRCI